MKYTTLLCLLGLINANQIINIDIDDQSIGNMVASSDAWVEVESQTPEAQKLATELNILH